jgi:hypothetical protein
VGSLKFWKTILLPSRLSLDAIEYSGTGLMAAGILTMYSTSDENSVVGFRGERTL